MIGAPSRGLRRAPISLERVPLERPANLQVRLAFRKSEARGDALERSLLHSGAPASEELANADDLQRAVLLVEEALAAQAADPLGRGGRRDPRELRETPRVRNRAPWSAQQLRRQCAGKQHFREPLTEVAERIPPRANGARRMDLPQVVRQPRQSAERPSVRRVEHPPRRTGRFRGHEGFDRLEAGSSQLAHREHGQRLRSSLGRVSARPEQRRRNEPLEHRSSVVGTELQLDHVQRAVVGELQVQPRRARRRHLRPGASEDLRQTPKRSGLVGTGSRHGWDSVSWANGYCIVYTR